MIKVHLLFYTGEGQNCRILLVTKKQGKLPCLPRSACTESDNFANSVAGARVVIDQLNNLQLRNLSINNEKCQRKVDYQSLNKASKQWQMDSKEEQEFMKYQRNPGTYTWSCYLNDCPLWNDDKEQHFFYYVALTNPDLEFILKNVPHSKLADLTHVQADKYQQLYKHVFGLLASGDFKKQDGRNVIFINFKPNGLGVYSPPGYFLDVVTFYNGIFRRRFDKWRVFSVAQGEFPSENDLSQAHYIIMPGSANCVYRKSHWIEKLEELLRLAYHKYTQIKILGICFGLQIIVQALGGKVDSMGYYFISGNTELKFDVATMSKMKTFQGLKLKSAAIINEAHGDEVKKYPSIFVTIGSSDSCVNEVMISKDERVLGFQGHPEYSTHLQMTLSLEGSSYSGSFLDLVKKWKSRQQPQDPINLEICKQFLKQ